jgi:RNA polymerase sigma-70 factor (ECF subfamily)
VGLGALLERHRARLHGAALAMLGNRAEAQDAVHETFVAAIVRLGEVRDPDAVGAWLRAVLRTRCLMELRRRRAGDAAAVAPYARAAPAAAEEAIERSALRDWLWTALGKLPEGPRLALMLRHFGSYESYREIGDILGVPVGTVRSRLAEARSRLGGLLLETLGAAGAEARALAERRRRFHLEAFRDLYLGGRRAFLSCFADDLLLRAGGTETRGRRYLIAEVESDLAAGVVFRPESVMASGEISVVEGAFLNPPEDPEHCPPAASMVLFGGEARIHRMHIHYSPRPPRGAGEEA